MRRNAVAACTASRVCVCVCAFHFDRLTRLQFDPILADPLF